MKAHAHRSARRRIRRLFTRGLPPAKHQQLVLELTACKACTAYYRDYHRLEAALCKSQPTPFALERVEAAVLAKLAGSADTLAQPASASRLLRWAWAGAVGFALIIFLILWVWRIPLDPVAHRVLLPPDARLRPIPLTARGPKQHKSAQVGIRVFRVTATGREVQERPGLARDDIITFTYTNVAEQIGYLALLGIQQGPKLCWYYPDYTEDQSIPILAGRVDEPLGDGIQLSVNHEIGWLRITAVFSSKPIDSDTLAAAIRRLAARPEAIEKLIPLELPSKVVLEHSVLVEIAPLPK